MQVFRTFHDGSDSACRLEPIALALLGQLSMAHVKHDARLPATARVQIVLEATEAPRFEQA